MTYLRTAMRASCLKGELPMLTTKDLRPPRMTINSPRQSTPGRTVLRARLMSHPSQY